MFGETLKLLKALEGLYKPKDEEVLKLAEIAKLNKLYLAFLRGLMCCTGISSLRRPDISGI
jgi:hypothetical protein